MQLVKIAGGQMNVRPKLALLQETGFYPVYETDLKFSDSRETQPPSISQNL